jgi:uncharacterized protein YuzE
MDGSLIRASFDPDADAAYIHLTAEPLMPGRTSVPLRYDGDEVLPEVVLDFKDGRLVGIEVLGARDGLAADLIRSADRPRGT